VSVLLDRLVSYHKLDEPSGTLVDSHSNNHGTGTGITYGAAGKVNAGASFDGVNDFIELENESNYDFNSTSPFSVSVWVNPTDLSATVVAVDKSDLTSELGWIVPVLVDNPATSDWSARFEFDGGTEVSGRKIRVTTNDKFSYGALHHIVITYSGSEAASGVKIYVDGVDRALTIDLDGIAGFSTLQNKNVSFGRRGGGFNDLYFGGVIDEVGIWSRALTAVEALSLWGNGNGLRYPFEGIMTLAKKSLAMRMI